MVTGDPPGETQMRRNLDAVMDGKHLLAIGGYQISRTYMATAICGKGPLHLQVIC